MKSTRTNKKLMIILAGLCLCVGIRAPAVAFQIGGHYYTLISVFSSDGAKMDDARTIEAFCAELPDLSKDLDAISQRLNVLFSLSDFRWGVRGQCGSSQSRHMVLSQFYLHALTGREVSVARDSALQMIKALKVDIETEKKTNNDPKRLANLYCERGFAAHLLGDTFAHAQLDWPSSSDEDQAKARGAIGLLYKTGLGHFRDNTEPDYMMRRNPVEYRRELRWQHWAELIANELDGRTSIRDAKQTVALMQKIDRVNDLDTARDREVEKKFSDTLRQQAPPEWLTLALPQGAKMLDLPTAGCAAQINAAVKPSGAHTPATFTPNALPDCQQVWDNYLNRARNTFPADYRPHLSCAIGPVGAPVNDPLIK